MHSSVFRHARIPVAILAATGVVGIGSALVPAVASAHVSADAPGLSQGGYGVITFRVPNESDKNAATTEVSVTLPDLKSARTEPIAGWKGVVTKNATEEATTVTWTALPGSPGIAVGEFGQFAISAGPLPEKEKVSFPAVQKYSDGETVNWNEPPLADGSEPDHPAPEIELAAATDDESGTVSSVTGSPSDTSDTTARWLGGAGLAVGVLGIAAAGVAIRRKP